MEPAKPSIKIFLASSAELKEDRDQFEIAIRRKNNIWQAENKPYLDLRIWETASEIMSQTRSQDEYNKIIKTVDIFVLLLWKIAGKYSQEEFQVANVLFQQTGRPKIIVYQKNSNDVTPDMILFLDKFRKVGQEYFYGQYNQFIDLKNSFDNELDIFFNNKYPAKLNPAMQARKDLIEGLEERYQTRLRKKMDTEIGFKLDLELAYTKSRTEVSFINKYYIDQYEEKQVGNFYNLFREYENNIKRLLILGDPGSGKTVLLIEFGLFLIRRAKENPLYPVPVLLNLASWRNENQNFETWLESNLVYAAGEFGISKQYAKELVNENNLLLLLDGLDEIPFDDRDSCLIKLQDFLLRSENAKEEHFPQVIISSRNKDYEEIHSKAPIKASLSILPLTDANLMSALNNRQNTSAQILLKKIEEMPQIAEKLRTAFMVHIALHLAHVYEFKDISEEGLLKAFIEQGITSLDYFDPKSERYLSYLAKKINETKKVNSFEMTDLKPTFLRRTYLYHFIYGFFWALFLYNIITLLIGGSLDWQNNENSLIFSIATGIVFITLGQLNPKFKIFRKTGHQKWYLRKLIRGPLLGILIWGIVLFWNLIKNSGTVSGYTFLWIFLAALLGLVVELIYLFFYFLFKSFIKVVNNSIDTYELQEFNLDRWDNKKFKQGLSEGFAIGCIVGIISLVFTVIREAIDMYRYRNFVNVEGVRSHPNWLFTPWFFVALPFALFAAAFSGVILAVIRGTFKGFFVIKKMPKINNAYIRLYAQFKYDLLQWFLVAFVYLCVGLIFNKLTLLQVFLDTIYISLPIAILTSPLYKHIILRTILYFKGLIPARFCPFLNEVSKTNLMEKDGGQWRFRHQMIQEYLAKKYDRPS